MEDDDINFERVLLGKGSVNAVSTLVGLKYLVVPFLNTRDSATGCFRGYLFSREDQNQNSYRQIGSL